MRAVERSCPRPLAFCLLSWQRCKRCKSGLWSSLSDENAAKRECGYFCTTSITESGPLYKQRIAICHIKEVTAILWHLLPIPQWIRMLISLFGHTLKQVTNMIFFAYYLHLSDIIIYDFTFTISQGCIKVTTYLVIMGVIIIPSVVIIDTIKNLNLNLRTVCCVIMRYSIHWSWVGVWWWHILSRLSSYRTVWSLANSWTFLSCTRPIPWLTLTWYHKEPMH